LITVGTIWYGLFRAIWAFHVFVYPEHVLADFWGRGISLSSFVLSFIMLFAVAPGALCAGLAATNCLAWLIRPARRAFDAEAAAHAGTGFRESTRLLLLCAAVAISVGLLIGLVAAYSLKSLR
jgi:hypothetical protein